MMIKSFRNKELQNLWEGKRSKIDARFPKRYTIHVNGPWSITFEFDAGDAYRVDFEQYH